MGVEKNGNGSWTMVSENDAPSSPPTRSIVPTHRRDVFKSFKMAWGWTSVGGGARVGTRGVGGAVVGAERTGRRSDDDGWGRRPTLHPHTPSFSHTDETSSNRSTWCGGGRWWGGGSGGGTGGGGGGTRGVGGAVVGTERRGRRSYDDG